MNIPNKLIILRSIVVFRSIQYVEASIQAKLTKYIDFHGTGN